jgi:hypothetical protein
MGARLGGPGVDSMTPELSKDLDAERAVLGAVLVNDAHLRKVRGVLGPQDFYRTEHGQIYGAMLELAGEGAPVDPVTVCGRLRGRVEPGVVSALIDGIPKAARAVSYALRVKETARRRALQKLSAGIVESAGNGVPFADVLRSVHDLADAGRAFEASQHPCARVLAEIPSEAIEYSVRDFLRRRGVHVIYGPSSAGKTFLLLRVVAELLAGTSVDLFGHPHLRMLMPWRRVLWVSAEETGGRLRARWDMVLAGMATSAENHGGGLLYRWAFEENAPVTLDRLEQVLDVDGDVAAVVLDSWTALAPPTFEGRTVEWDADNYATRRLLGRLRELVERRHLVLLIVHHTGKDLERGPRGPSELVNGADTVIRLEPKPQNHLRVVVEKQRDGPVLPAFVLKRSFDTGAYRARYEEPEEKTVRLTAGQAQVLAFLTGRGTASAAHVIAGTGLKRPGVRDALDALAERHLIEPTGETDERRSPLWRVVARGGAPGGVDE